MQSPRGGIFSRVSQGFGFGKTSRNNQRDNAPTSATSEVSINRQACVEPRTPVLRRRVTTLRLTLTIAGQITRMTLSCKQRLTFSSHCGVMQLSRSGLTYDAACLDTSAYRKS